MTDCWGRDIHYLRLSVTDRCNLRCRYCMPEEGVTPVPHDQVLTYEEMLEIVRALAGLGIDRVRITGGEPLVRRDLTYLVAGLKAIPGIRWVGLTTNGILLSDQLPGLMQAGLDGVNISLDALEPQVYQTITRRDELARALAGLEAARNTPGLKVKVNCVPTRENRSQWVPLAQLAQSGPPLDVRFIQLMPIGCGRDMAGADPQEVYTALERAFGPASPVETAGQEGPARLVTFPGFAGRVGFISAVSQPFCEGCNRIRITPEGVVKPCLQYDSDLSVRGLVRSGMGGFLLQAVLQEAIYQKPRGHHFSRPDAPGDEHRTMSEIGG